MILQIGSRTTWSFYQHKNGHFASKKGRCYHCGQVIRPGTLFYKFRATMGDKISISGTFLQEVSRFVGSDDKDFTRKQRILEDLNLNELADFTWTNLGGRVHNLTQQRMILFRQNMKHWEYKLMMIYRTQPKHWIVILWRHWISEAEHVQQASLIGTWTDCQLWVHKDFAGETVDMVTPVVIKHGPGTGTSLINGGFFWRKWSRNSGFSSKPRLITGGDYPIFH